MSPLSYTATASGAVNGRHYAAPSQSPVEAPVWPLKPKHPFPLDESAYLDSVNARYRAVRDDRDRSDWLDARLMRYAKYRGWIVEEKTTPWEGAADCQPPLLQIAELRTGAGLHNALLSNRPLLQAKGSSGRADLAPREEKITALVDAQLFVDPGPSRAERQFGDFVSNFLQDGNAVVYTPWSRDQREQTAYVYRPPTPMGMDPEEYLISILTDVVPGFDPLTIERDADKTNVYTATVRRTPQTPPDDMTVTVYQDEDGYLELWIRRAVTLYDGPVWRNLAIEDVYLTSRSENLQPPSDANPNGAPFVFVKVKYYFDQVRRHQESGTFNYCTKETLEVLEGQLRAQASTKTFGEDSQALQIQKDAIEGTMPSTPPVMDPSDLVHLTQSALLCFDRWDTGQGTEDILTILALDASDQATHVLEARCLAERYPGDRPWRPLAEACCFPVPGRYYGISLLELGEHLHDYIKGLMDQGSDTHAITGLPFFFYSQTAKIAQEVMRIAPGEGIPAPGDPRSTIYFPNIPARDQTYTFQMLQFAVGLFERLMMVGDLQLGRVPTGKASALRTVGTTTALLQQGDVRADQLLIRLFSGIQQAAAHYHRLNRHLLPPGKEIRRVGWDGEREQGYVQFEQGHTEIDYDMDFEFRPDFLLSNPQILAATMQTALAVIATPLAFQAGVVGPEQYYRLLRDYCKGSKLDPKQYLMPPPAEPGAPISAPEAISAIVGGQLPVGPPLEGAEAHMQALIEFHNSDQFGLLTPDRVQIFKAYWLQTSDRLRKVKLGQAAAASQEAFAQTGGGSSMGASGAETSVQEPDITTQMPGAAEQAAPKTESTVQNA